MPIGWMDVSRLPFDAVLLLEPFQYGWMSANPCLSAANMGVALCHNPAVAWRIQQTRPDLAAWVDALIAQAPASSPEQIRAAEVDAMGWMEDWLVYAVDPSIYDAQSFTAWDDSEVSGLVDFTGKSVCDVGAGTGRLALIAARHDAAAVYAVEPVGRLREYLREKSSRLGLANFYVQEGWITRLPFPDDFFDVVLSGHVYGDEPQAEADELERVTRPGGMIILAPGNADRDDEAHACLLSRGFHWTHFYEGGEPRPARKYWKTV